MRVEKLASELAFEHRRLWLALGWTLVLGVIGLSVMPDTIEVLGTEGDKFGHLPAWFSNLYEDLIPRLILAIGFVAMDIALEFVQEWSGFRIFDVADMAANASGVFVG